VEPVLKGLIALALAVLAGAGVTLSALCAVVLVVRILDAGPVFLPPLTGADTATLAIALVAGCLVASACHHGVRKGLRIGSIRQLLARRGLRP